MKSNPFENSVLKNLKKICPQAESKTFLLAVSGGVDSIVLTHILYNLNLKFEIAHCNFELRGKDSDADEELVKEIAFEMSVPFHVKRFPELKNTNKGKSIQLLARELRYKWFNELIQERNMDHLILAHHANDNFETALYQFVKGTGLKGLKGIPSVNDKILRPLLNIEKLDIQKYAKTYKIHYRDDKSNDSTKYNRNLIRLEVIPLLERINPDLISTFQKHTTLYTDAQNLIESETTRFKESSTSNKNDLFKINFEELNSRSGKLNILLTLLEPYGFSLDQIHSVFRSESFQSGKMLLSKTHRLVFNRNELLISPIEKKEETYLIHEIPATIKTNSGQLQIEMVESNKIQIKDSNTVFLKTEIKQPLLIRPWKQADLFHPSGMEGKKQKLHSYYINNKYSLPDKENQLLLTSEDQICWIIGKRGDERYLEKDQTLPAIKVTWQPKNN